MHYFCKQFLVIQHYFIFFNFLLNRGVLKLYTHINENLVKIRKNELSCDLKDFEVISLKLSDHLSEL
jgi:hypothetical protein